MEDFKERQDQFDFYHPQRNLGKPGSFRRVKATYIKYGKTWRDGKGGRRVFDKKALFRNVVSLDGRYGTDHLWVDWVDDFDILVPGDSVLFSGVVQSYTAKGNNGDLYRTNTHLVHIQDVKVL